MQEPLKQFKTLAAPQHYDFVGFSTGTCVPCGAGILVGSVGRRCRGGCGDAAGEWFSSLRGFFKRTLFLLELLFFKASDIVMRQLLDCEQRTPSESRAQFVYFCDFHNWF